MADRDFMSPESSSPSLRLAEVMGGLSYALDLAEGHRPGHALRSCWIGMHVGQALGLDCGELSELFYVLLLKDAGSSSVASRMCELFDADERGLLRGLKTASLHNAWGRARYLYTHAWRGDVRTLPRLRKSARIAKTSYAAFREIMTARGEQGASVARQMGFGHPVATGIENLNEHWNGKGLPKRLEGDSIPMVSRVALLAQTADVFHSSIGQTKALQEVTRRSGTWFDPAVVEAFRRISEQGTLWNVHSAADLELRVMSLEPRAHLVRVDEDRLDRVAEGFGRVIDAKSSFTSGHSLRVADMSEAMACEFGLSPTRQRWIRRAGLLHDIGKLSVSNLILDKPERLDAKEWAEIHKYPIYTEDILSRVGPFHDLARLAGALHERVDGRGYPRGLGRHQITIETRIVSVADIYDALTADRPQRKSMTRTKALSILYEMLGTALDAECVRLVDRVVCAKERRKSPRLTTQRMESSVSADAVRNVRS